MTDPKPSQESRNYAAMFHEMATQGGGPAHPIQMEVGKSANGEPTIWFSMGMSKREEFASRFMAGLLSNGQVPDNKEDLCTVAVLLADAILERLKK